jgi:hypothetical protein
MSTIVIVILIYRPHKPIDLNVNRLKAQNISLQIVEVMNDETNFNGKMFHFRVGIISRHKFNL